MAASENSAPTYFNSSFRHGVDEKRRVAVPAKWRPAQEGVELTLILWPQAQEGTCIRGMLPDQMAALMRKLDELPDTNPSKVPIKRYIGIHSAQVTVDRSGRICLPEEMAKAAGIKGEAVLGGLLNVFEIWNPERYDKVEASTAIMAQEAFKMMG